MQGNIIYLQTFAVSGTILLHVVPSWVFLVCVYLLNNLLMRYMLLFVSFVLKQNEGCP